MKTPKFKNRRAALVTMGALGCVPLSNVVDAGGSIQQELEVIEQIPQADDNSFIQRAFQMKDEAVAVGDQGYGAVVVRDGIILGQAPSAVVVNNDPTAHAEMQAIRDAAARIGSRDLSGCTLFSSSHPCPMCEAASYWAGIERMVFSRAITDAGRPSLC